MTPTTTEHNRTIPARTPVTVKNDGHDLTGSIESAVVLNDQVYYVVKLAEGFWSEDNRIFVSLLLVHGDNVTPTEGAK